MASFGWLFALALSGCANASGGAAKAKEARSTGADVQLGFAPLGACVTTSPEVCFNATDDNCNGIVDEGCGVRSGLLQFVIAWPEPNIDVDLEVRDPDEHLAEVGGTSVSGLIKERDCPGRSNECRGLNFENVVLEAGRELVRGTYVVTVRAEDLGDSEGVDVALAVRFGPKHFATRLRLTHDKEERRFALAL